MSDEILEIPEDGAEFSNGEMMAALRMGWLDVAIASPDRDTRHVRDVLEPPLPRGCIRIR